MSPAPRSLVHHGALGATLALTVALGGCTSQPTGFVSDNPFGGQNPNGEDASGSGGAGGSDSGGDPARAITEADIIQIDGTRLYALSRYGGLSIIDIGTKDKLTMLGRYRVSGMPFEMYLRGSTVYAMFSGWGSYQCNAAGDVCDWVESSHVEALDVTSPAHIQKLGSFELPGAVSDSRIVGDVLYAVTYEDGYCWNCQSQPNTTITSLDVHDAGNVGVVDQLTYATPDPNDYGWWRRSISVTADRMYVGGVDWSGSGQGHSTIQVVDISDPAGHLVEGAAVQVKGQIESRWQMDETGGVLRVISQPGMWNTAEPPVLQTFQVTSATQLTPLAELPLVLPTPERLRSVRFDGARAFAITAVQTDPLFTLDLTDPAHPAQVGELAMPGWVYFLEPRGDRLYALGYEQSNAEGSLAVSLLDVADLANPSLLTRVHFGGDWSDLPEDQDRIHKSFKIDDDNGAIFVPFSAWNYDDPNGYYGCGSYDSGIQIVDFTHDALTLRGVAKAKGEARRAFVHDARLFGVSDAAVSTFDITDRSAPVQKAEIALSTNVSQAAVAGDKLVRLSDDWWTGAARLDVVPLADPARATPLGTIDLATIDQSQDNWCWGWSYWGAKMFAHGDLVYLARTSGYYYDWEDGGGSASPTAEVTVIDLSNAAAPAVRGKVSFALPTWYSWHGGVISAGDDIVQLGTTIVFRSVAPKVAGDTSGIEQATLEIVSVADPDHPAHTSLALPSGYGHTSLLAAGSTVRTSHWAPVAGDDTKVRFYVDEIDVSAPAAPALASINVPGSLLAYDAPSGRMLTVDYQRLVNPGMLYSACTALYGGNAEFKADDPGNYTDWPNVTGTCTGLHRTVELLDVEGGVASVGDELALDDKLSLSQPLAGDDRVFAWTGYSYYYDTVGGGVGTSAGPQVFVLGGMREGTLQSASAQLDTFDYGYGSAVSGKKLVLTGYSPPELSVLDTTDLAAPAVVRKADLDGYPYNVTVSGNLAICSLGPYGLQTVDLSH
jgi:hypothetical protein